MRSPAGVRTVVGPDESASVSASTIAIWKPTYAMRLLPDVSQAAMPNAAVTTTR